MMVNPAVGVVNILLDPVDLIVIVLRHLDRAGLKVLAPLLGGRETE